MIQSLFILSPTGEVLIERHFRGVVTSRSVCDLFWERASASVNHHGGVSLATSLLSPNEQQQHYDTVPPVMEIMYDPHDANSGIAATSLIPTGGDQQQQQQQQNGTTTSNSNNNTIYVISILRDGLSYLAICPGEVSPLLVIEFLHRVANIFVDYFGSPADESVVKDNFSTIYQVIEEMIDYGWPLTTEPNALKSMIRPPTVMSRLLQTSTQVNEELPSGTVGNMPWRTSNVQYTQNEIYIDIVEEVDAMIDAKTGQLILCDVSGSLQCQCHLSGVPDLLLTFKDPALIDDCSFHPCVRYHRYEADHVISFVPPDGDFELMRYRIPASKARAWTPPLYCHPQWTFNTGTGTGGGTNNAAAPSTTSSKTSSSQPETTTQPTQTGRLMIQAGVAASSSLIYSAMSGAAGGAGAASTSGPVQVEDVAITIPFPKQTKSMATFHVTVGSVIYDEASKVARWSLGNMDATKKASLTCTFQISTKPLHSRTSNMGRRSSTSQQPATATATAAAMMAATNVNMNSLICSTLTDLDDDDDDGTNGGAIYRPQQRRNTNNTANTTTTATTTTITPPNLSMNWKIPLTSVSGLAVSGLSITSETYRCYKGVRNITKAGLFQLRGS